MKKVISVLTCLCLMLSALAGMAMPATASADFLYTVDAGGATVTGYIGDDFALTVPDTLGGYAVVAVGANAFENNTVLTQVQLPASVKTIDECAFYGCSSLTTVTLGFVSFVGFDAFFGCTSLKNVSFCGSEREWQTITIARGNDALQHATLTFLDMSTGISLLPTDMSDFHTLSEGNGTISITPYYAGYSFKGTGGWPSAYTRRTADEYVTVDVFSDTYLNFDFTVSGGKTNIILAFNGMDIVDMRTVGHYVTLNRLIDPIYVDENGIIYDLNTGTYTASVHVGALGCDPSLVTNGTFSISDIKIYSVEGAEVIVRDLSVGEAKYDVMPLPQTSYRITAAQSLLPEDADGFVKHNTASGTVYAYKVDTGYTLLSTDSWPDVCTARYESGEGYAYASLDDYIYYDFTVYDAASTHIVVYFGGAPTSTEAYGTYASLNPFIHPNYMSGGVVYDLPRGTYKGFIRVGDLNPDLSLMQDGKIPVSDLRIYVVRGFIDVRELAVVEIETYTSATTTTSTTATTSTTTTTTVTAPAVTYSVSVSQQEVVCGSQVEVAFNLSEGHHLVNGQLWIDYDPNVLELQDPFEVGCITDVNTAIFDSTYMWDAGIPAPGRLKFAFASCKLDGTTTGGTMFTLTFDVIGMPENGTTAITISAPETGAAVNGVDFNITPTFESAAFTVSPFVGDVDSNGKIDIYDAMRLFKFINEEITLEGAELAACEVNGDGETDIFDAMHLFKFVNEEIDHL